MLPKATRMELVLWPGESTHMCLIWVETDKGWDCYTTLAGVNKYARITVYDVQDTEHLFALIDVIYSDCRKMDKEAQIRHKAELRQVTTTD